MLRAGYQGIYESKEYTDEGSAPCSRFLCRFAVCFSPPQRTLKVLTRGKDIKEAATRLQRGTYYGAEGAWDSMEEITMSGGGGKHMAKIFVPGLTPQTVSMGNI